jgi:hypothetical protein
MKLPAQVHEADPVGLLLFNGQLVQLVAALVSFLNVPASQFKHELPETLCPAPHVNASAVVHLPVEASSVLPEYAVAQLVQEQTHPFTAQ